MHPTDLLLLTLLATPATAHGVVTEIQGANGVNMPGLSGAYLPSSPLRHSILTFPLPVADGTPRDCSSNGCGSQADTAIIRDREIRAGTVGPLGRTQGNGPIDAATMVANFMGAGAAPKVNAATASVGVEDDLTALGSAKGGKGKAQKRESGLGLVARQFLKGLQGLFGGGGTASAVKTESNVAATAGEGASSGLPTCADDGTITMVFHQVSLCWTQVWLVTSVCLVSR